MTEITTGGFDYGELSESEQRHFRRIADEVREIQGVTRKTNVEAAVKIGERLSDAQDRLANRKNGTFQAWVETEFDMTLATAYRAIRVYSFNMSCQRLARHFDLSAIHVISQPSCPEPAKREALKLANSGKIVTHKLAKSIVEKHKATTQNSLPADYSPHGKPAKTRKRSPAKEAPREGETAARQPDRPTRDADSNAGENRPRATPPAAIETPADDMIDAEFSHVDGNPTGCASNPTGLAGNPTGLASGQASAADAPDEDVPDEAPRPSPVVSSSSSPADAPTAPSDHHDGPVDRVELPSIADVLDRINAAGDAIEGYATSDDGRTVDVPKALGCLHQAKKVVAGGTRPHVIAGDVSMPPSIDTPDGRAALGDWLLHKRKRGESYKDAGQVAKQLKRFAEFTSVEFRHAVDFSIGQNYAGLFAEKTNGGRVSGQRSAPGSEYRPGVDEDRSF